MHAWLSTKISIGFCTSTLKSWSRSLKWMASFVASTKEFISASAVDIATHLWTFVDQLTTAELLLSLKQYPEVLFLWSKFPAQSASEKHSKVNLSPLLKTKLFDLEPLRYLKTLFPAFQCFSPGFSTNLGNFLQKQCLVYLSKLNNSSNPLNF